MQRDAHSRLLHESAVECTNYAQKDSHMFSKRYNVIVMITLVKKKGKGVISGKLWRS